MIRITKTKKPAVLIKNGDAWTKRYVELRAKNEPIPDSLGRCYADAEIKAALEEEAHEKCAYCESRVNHVYPGDVEHIRPKSKHPELICAWENLTYACWQCNHDKGQYCSDLEPLVNPFTDEPQDHIKFYGPWACEPTGNDLGQRTIDVIGLNRAALIDRRTDKLEELRPLLARWHKLPDGDLKTVTKKQIESLAGSDKEYSSAVTFYLKDQLS